MVDVQEVVKAALDHFPFQPGAFYGSTSGLSVGTGLIFDGIRFADYDIDVRGFDTLEGAVLVVSHECDISQENSRFFSEQVLVYPIIRFDDFAFEFVSSKSEQDLLQFLPDLAGNRVFQAFYLPPIDCPQLRYGGIVYFNYMSSTHVTEFEQERANSICALSGYAQGIIDKKLENHFLRPKAEKLPILM